MQGVGSPRFYINVLEWLHSIDALETVWKVYHDTMPTTWHWLSQNAEEHQNLYSLVQKLHL